MGVFILGVEYNDTAHISIEYYFPSGVAGYKKKARPSEWSSNPSVQDSIFQ